MTDLSQLATRSIEGLGRGAYLVTLLPSTIIMLSGYALASSALYPWATSPMGSNHIRVQPGLAAIVKNTENLSGVGIGLCVLAVLGGAVLLKPFQLTAVQILEGYWSSKPIPRMVEEFRIEHHRRRRAIAVSLKRARYERPDADMKIASVMAYERNRDRTTRTARRAGLRAQDYPLDPQVVLPTRLGNVLRRGESTAGERYGLDTVVTFPRLHPFVSPPLLARIDTVTDLLDTTSTFVFVFAADSILAAPLFLRDDRWSVIPIISVILAAVCYAGAINAARILITEYATAYDLHRFDMLAGLHRRLPQNAAKEFDENLMLSDFLIKDEPLNTAERAKRKYWHATQEAPASDTSGKSAQ